MAEIIVDRINVDLPVYGAQQRSLKGAILGGMAGAGRVGLDRGHIVVQALRGVSLTARDGDRIALVGRNGAGKSTLLRAMAGLTEPNAGSVQVKGKLTTLFSVGSYLDGNATGYENLRLAGGLLGLSNATIAAITPDVEAFTELGEYMHLPVRTYSAGMQIRLAFAIATAIEPEILLMDEAIGAGDAHFIYKATNRAKALYERSSIIVIASHDPGILKALCNRAVLMESGRIIAEGDVATILTAYAKHGATPTARRSRGMGARRVFGEGLAVPDSDPKHVVDGDAATSWAVKKAAGSYIAVDMADLDGDLRPSVYAVTIEFLEKSGFEVPAQLLVETSNDFFVADRRLVATLRPARGGGKKTFLVRSDAHGAQWRIRPADDAHNAPWGVVSLAFHRGPLQVLSDAASERRMPGYVLTEDDGAWITAEMTPGREDEHWIGVDYGPEVQISPNSLTLRLWDDGSGLTAPEGLRVECSDDGFVRDIRRVADVATPRDAAKTARIALPDHGQKASQWRVLALSTPPQRHWGLRRLYFETDDDVAPATNERAA